jgi:hypothetical protein
MPQTVFSVRFGIVYTQRKAFTVRPNSHSPGCGCLVDLLNLRDFALGEEPCVLGQVPWVPISAALVDHPGILKQVPWEPVYVITGARLVLGVPWYQRLSSWAARPGSAVSPLDTSGCFAGRQALGVVRRHVDDQAWGSGHRGRGPSGFGSGGSTDDTPDGIPKVPKAGALWEPATVWMPYPNMSSLG